MYSVREGKREGGTLHLGLVSTCRLVFFVLSCLFDLFIDLFMTWVATTTVLMLNREKEDKIGAPWPAASTKHVKQNTWGAQTRIQTRIKCFITIPICSS